MSNFLLPATFVETHDGEKSYHVGFQDIEQDVKTRVKKWITLEEFYEIDNIPLGHRKEIERVLSLHI